MTHSSDSQFRTLTDETAVSLQGNDWYGDGGHHICSPGSNNLRSINEVSRNSIQLPSDTFLDSGFIDVLSVHNIYIHSPNLGHHSSIGVKGENTIFHKCQFQAVSVTYLILDSVVASHDNIDVRKQLRNQNCSFYFEICTWERY